VIDPARGGAGDVGVDHVATVIERKKERVVRIVRIRGRSAIGFPPGDALATVLDDALAFADQAGRIYAPAMNARVADDDFLAACLGLRALV
jgi:hypothetical protein